MKNILLVGAGNRAYELFIKPMNTESYQDSIIVGVYDTNIKRAAYLCSLAPYTIPVISSIEEISEIVNLELIIIMTPDYTHEPLISYFLEHTLADIVCEKPLCTTLDQARFLYSLSPESKDRISVLLNSRFMPISCWLIRITVFM